MGALTGAFFCALSIVGCSSPTSLHQGVSSRDPASGGDQEEPRAWGRPWVQSSSLAISTGRATALTVLSHRWVGTHWRLILQPEEGLPEELLYQVAGRTRLPIEVGETLRFSQSARGLGLSVREMRGRLRVLISSDGQPDTALGEAIVPTFERKDHVYHELISPAAGCAMAVDHYALMVRVPGRHLYVMPGSITRVELPNRIGDNATRSYDLYALDSSRETARRVESTDCPQLAHTSWMLVAQPDRL